MLGGGKGAIEHAREMVCLKTHTNFRLNKNLMKCGT